MSVNIKTKVSEKKGYLNDVDWEALFKAVKLKSEFQNKPKSENWEEGELIDAILDESNILTDNVIRYYFGDESVISEDFGIKNEAIKQIEVAFLDKIVKRSAENFDYATFEKIASTIIFDDVTWFKIVGIFAFYAKMASHCKEIGKKTIIASTSTYVGKFLTQNNKTLQFLKENGTKGNIYKNMKPVKKIEVNVEILKKKILGIFIMGVAFITNYV